MKKKWILAIVVLVVAAGVFLGFTLFGRNKSSGIKYRTDTVTRGDIEAVIITTGTLNPVTVVDVGSQVSGRISQLYADFNSMVKKGQVVAELDQSLFMTRVEQNEANYQSAIASLERAKVTLDNLKKKYERALNLFEKNLISFEEKEAAETQHLTARADLQSAEARVEQAKSQLESTKVDLAYTIIRSPIDGVVISRNVNVGQIVAASFQAPVLFKIADDLSKMQVECNVDEADIGKVKEGQKARFTVDAFPGENYFGAVSQVRYYPEVVQNVVTYTTIIDVGNPELKLRPGMTATVSIIAGEANDVLRVSNAALRFTPPLSPEQMEEIMKVARQAMMERAQAAGAGQRPQMMAGGERRGPGVGPTDGRTRQPSRVWILDKNGKPFPVPIRPGVTDNTYTEILRGDLEEGQFLLIGVESGGPTQAAGASSSQRRPDMMFIRR